MWGDYISWIKKKKKSMVLKKRKKDRDFYKCQEKQRSQWKKKDEIKGKDFHSNTED